MSTDEEVPLATRQMHEAFVTISQQMLQFRVNTARITTPSDYEPQEVWVIYETLECPDQRQYMRSRGLVSRNKLWMLMETETDKDWKYFTHIFSDDCKVCVFVAESIEMGHDKDVIQVEDVQYKKAKFTDQMLISNFLEIIKNCSTLHYQMKNKRKRRDVVSANL
ncbi:Dipeptidyl Peptidase Four (IV) family [Caenorhabditis elegans]|uniref:Dipeptidyl Peptidase Four (IV) family n=1 Tax=Caenorhabditis elegans TaxID=6239 RepID=Q8MXE4_CAEEL|nr:Dipeptidyl Peptidase Four (IV) family [Caenorhabditis elegans]CCD72243.1 Dipeptidyl Peptidase Four (IV) family [Caenorhabditis elegans]|eukprot:NP_741387.1 Dipeptidyl Peptidase Four (IV) family [Caenorhabditis elegans]